MNGPLTSPSNPHKVIYSYYLPPLRPIPPPPSPSQELRSGVIANVFDKLYSDFCEASTWEVFPDVHPTLKQLKAAGLSLGVVSNFDDRLG